MLLSGRCLNRGNHLAIHAKLRKAVEGCILFLIIITHCLIQPNHALLNDILVIRTNQEIGSRLCAHQKFIFIQQKFLCLLIAALRQQYQLLIPCCRIFLFSCHFCHKNSPLLFIFFDAIPQTMPRLPHPDGPPEYYFSAVCSG